jgi:16S rRNA (cytidine1402-2'-O)-methyltransferase
MAAVLGDRPAVIARELTKLHEEISRGLLTGLAQRYAEGPAPKGEITVLIGPARDEGPDFVRIDALLDQALPFMPVRAASELIASALGIARRAVYDRALERKRDD